MSPFSWRQWIRNVIGPSSVARRSSKRLMVAELLEDRLVLNAGPLVTHNIYVVGALVNSSVLARHPLFTDKLRFNDSLADASSVEEIGATTTWVAPSLRAAVLFANANPGVNNILLDTTSTTPYLLSLGEIDLHQDSGTLTIKNKGAGISTIDGDGESRIFSDCGGAAVTLDHLKLTNGDASADGGDAQGGAVANFATMTLTNDLFVDNSLESTEAGNNPAGGAIYNDGTMTLSNDRFTGNVAYGGTATNSPNIGGESSGAALGGALYNDAGSPLTIKNSVFTDNLAEGAADFDNDIGADAGGGAIYIEGSEINTVSITGTTFTDNNAVGGSVSGGEGSSFTGGTARGGAIETGVSAASGATLNLSGCTFNDNGARGGSAVTSESGDSAGGGDAYGGGLFVDVNANIVNCTFVCNTAVGGFGDNDNGEPAGLVAFGGNAGGGGIGADFSEDNSVNLVNDTIAFNSALAGAAFEPSGGFGGPLNHAPAFSGVDGAAYGGGVAALELLKAPVQHGANEFSFTQPGMNVVNTIVAKNSVGTAQLVAGPLKVNTRLTTISGGPDVAGAFNSAGHNLIGAVDDDSVGFTNGVNGDQVGTVAHPIAPGFDPRGLRNNGGLTLTIGLVAGSNAINKGDSTFAGFALPPTTDQRGLPRIFGPAVDIGAFESELSANRGRDSLGLAP